MNEAVFEKFYEELTDTDKFRYHWIELQHYMETTTPEQALEEFMSTNPTHAELEQHLREVDELFAWLDEYHEALQCRKIELEQPRRSDEAKLRDALAFHLQQCGFTVATEAAIPGGRCDIFAATDDGIDLLVEVKVTDPIRAVGQLYGYSHGRATAPTKILALPSGFEISRLLTLACLEANIEVWLIDANGTPHFALLLSRP